MDMLAPIRTMVDKRIFPAIDIYRSGKHNERIVTGIAIHASRQLPSDP